MSCSAKSKRDFSKDRLISRSEFARRIGLSLATVWRNFAKFRANGLKEVQVGGRVLIDSTTIDSTLERMRTDN
jgi:DNA-binding transcriptional MocR family regulator